MVWVTAVTMPGLGQVAWIFNRIHAGEDLRLTDAAQYRDEHPGQADAAGHCAPGIEQTDAQRLGHAVGSDNLWHCGHRGQYIAETTSNGEESDNHYNASYYHNKALKRLCQKTADLA